MNEESLLRLSVFVSVLLLMAVWQAWLPRKKLLQGYKRWPGNLGLIVVDALFAKLLLPAGAVGAALWAEQHGVGLLPALGLADAVTLILAVIVLDLVIYLQHVLFHAMPMLWRLHQVHHADRDIDVTTGLRFHPVEIVISMLIKITSVAALGVPALAVVIFEVILNAMAMFNHSNIHLPRALDSALRLLLVTPDMHRVHHSVLVHETNSNYGFNLSLWDRLFGTYRAQPEQGHGEMVIGLPEYQNQPTHQLSWMLRLPFKSLK